MKKLMVLALVAVAAAFVNASTVDWKLSGATGKSYYIFNGDVTSALTAAFSDTTDGGVAAFNAYLGENPADATGTGARSSSGKISGSVADSLTFLILNDTLEEGKTYEMGTLSTAGYTYLPPPEGQQTSPGNLTYTYAGKTTGTIAAASVPEPTSGLLLLLGVAGMALRRRRA